MAGSHILVESVDGSNTGHLTVLLVHVVGTGARIVADPDTEVLDLLGALLVDLMYVSPCVGGLVRRETSISYANLHAPGLPRQSRRSPS